jgi:predicted PurR-regulated permease PerM
MTGDTSPVATPAPPHLPAGERLRRLGIAAWSIIGLIILASVVVWALFKISVIFPPLVFALVIIYTLNPIVSRMERRGIPRGVGVAVAYVVVLGTFTLVVILLIPLVSNQVEDFSDDWPQFRAEIVEFVQESAQSIEDRFGTEIDTTQVSCLFGADELEGPDAPTVEECDEVTRDLREQVAAQAGRLVEFSSSALHLLLALVIGTLIALYLLIDLPQLRRDFVNLVPQTHREEMLDVSAKLGRAVGGFFRGQLLVALIVGLLSSLGFWLIGLPFWLVIGAIAGLTNLIPLIGPFIGGGLGLLIGTITDGVGLGLKAALVALVVQQLDNHIVSPNVMRRTVNLHPVTVMLGLLAGGTLAGIWGVLLAVPAIAVTKIVAGHLWATRVLGVEVSPHIEGRPEPAQKGDG